MLNGRFSLIVLILCVFLLQNCQDKTKIVAKVGSLPVSQSDFVRMARKQFPNLSNFQHVDMNTKKKILDSTIRLKTKLLAAYDLNLDKDIEFQTAVEKNSDQLINIKYYEKIVLDHFAPDEVATKIIQRRGIRFHVSDILIANKGFDPRIKRSKEEAREIAGRVSKLAKSGENFVDLVTKYSDDPGTKAKAGKMPVFSWGRLAHIREFADAVWDMEIGEISNPVDTKIGFHIVRLDNRTIDSTYVPDESKENQYRIKRTFFRAYTDTARKYWTEHCTNLRDEYEYEIIPGAMDHLINILKQKIQNKNIVYENSQDLLEITLARWKGGEINFATIMNPFISRFNNSVGKYQNQYVLKNELEQISLQKLVVTDSKKYGIENLDEIREKVSVFFEERLRSAIEKQEVSDKIEISDEEVKIYYEKNLDKFRKRDEMEIWQIYLTDKKEAEEIMQRVKAGESFTTLAREYSKAQESAAKGGYLGYQTERGLGTLSLSAFNLGPDGKIGGPVNYNKGWSIFKTGKKRKSSARPFNEIEKRVRNLTLSDRIKENRLAWEQKLLDKYETIVYENVLKEI
jgi:parvulin-like peptidyl-prolyl isomerase